MTVYIGVDFHPYERSVAYVDDRDGEIGYRQFLHSDKQAIKAFYSKYREDVVIGTDELTVQIKALEARLEKKREEDERAKLLMTRSSSARSGCTGLS